MTNRPCTNPPHLSEKPKGSGFRNMVFLVLAGMATTGIGGYLIGKLSGDKSNKPDITDTRGSSGESGDDDPDRVPKGWIPVDGKTAEYVNLAQCRELVLKLDSRVISEDELLKMAEKIKNDKKNITAEGIIENFCIQDASDKKKIKDLISKGFRLKKVTKNKDGTWMMTFINPLSADEANEEWLDLNEKHVCKLLTPDEESDLEKARKKAQRKKELVENLKKGNIDEELSQFDTKKIMEEARYQGVENEEVIKELVKSIDKMKKTLKSSSDLNEKRKVACELIPFLIKLEVLINKIKPQAKKAIENNPNIPIDKFGIFLEALAESLGIDDLENCILYQAGITPKELMDSTNK